MIPHRAYRPGTNKLESGMGSIPFGNDQFNSAPIPKKFARFREELELKKGIYLKREFELNKRNLSFIFWPTALID